MSYRPRSEIAELPLKEGGSRIGVRDDEEGLVPRKISIAREAIFLRALADTGNATLAAERAGVSWSWAYKRREVDARFDALFREISALARARLPVQVRRDRYGGWTTAKEARFIERLRETCSVWLAAAAVGLSAGSAYQRRRRKPDFADAWDVAEGEGWPPADHPWIESVICFFEGRSPPRDNPVRIRGIDDVLNAMNGKRFAPRPPRSPRS